VLRREKREAVGRVEISQRERRSATVLRRLGTWEKARSQSKVDWSRWMLRAMV
jgi:hypothetical protein